MARPCPSGQPLVSVCVVVVAVLHLNIRLGMKSLILWQTLWLTTLKPKMSLNKFHNTGHWSSRLEATNKHVEVPWLSVENLLTDRHLIDRHLADRHFADAMSFRHSFDRHLKSQLAEWYISISCRPNVCRSKCLSIIMFSAKRPSTVSEV
jgi:hypothetical protein